jgi:hypothetical protein
MRWVRFLALLAVIHALGISLLAQAPSTPQDAELLALRLSSQPLVLENTPLTRALQGIGYQVREGYVLFGAEVRLEEGKEPTVSLNLPPACTLGEALTEVFRQVPNYEYKIVGPHLINVYPKGAESNPEDLLNLRVERFDVVDQLASFLVTVPMSFIPRLMGRLTPSGQPGGVAGSVMSQVGEPTVTLHMRNATVREILNAVAQATEQFPPNYLPLGWVYSFQPDSTSAIGGLHSWKPLYSVPPNWKLQADEGHESKVLT